jgi:hypothetical protein
MSQRYFTLEEAEALVPELERILRSVRTLKKRVDEKVAAWRKTESTDAAQSALVQGQVDFLVAEINRELEKVFKLGAHPKDMEQGLVDFPARFEGKEGYLCWKSGEKRIGFWHGLTEGYSGRRPLKRAKRPD